MDENELLLRHAERWASDRGRKLDAELLGDALSLRGVHDGWAANRWPTGSARHLMLVRWPAHGPQGVPDVDGLVTSLDTFWSFLRATGRMASGSGEPKDLRREATAAGKRMAAACADPVNYSSSKSLFAFGVEIGINMDDLKSLDEANERMQQITDAWNALPQDERIRRSPGPAHGGSRMGMALTDAANAMLQTGSIPEGWEMPEAPRLDDEEKDEPVFPSDPELSAPYVRDSGFFRQILALAEWVGTGRQVTQTGVLRPAVAREAYQALGLWEWEREWFQAGGVDFSVDPDAESAAAEQALNGWRTALDCFPLMRLWAVAVELGLVKVGSKEAIRGTWSEPDDAIDWVHVGLSMLFTQLEMTEEIGFIEPLLGILLMIGEEYGGPVARDELREWWRESPINEIQAYGLSEDLVQHLSDITLNRCLAMFDDFGLWKQRKGYLVGTPFGWDAALLLMHAEEAGLLDQFQYDDE